MNELKTCIGPEFCAALAKAQGEIQGAVKDSSNPFFKSSYADMESVIESFRKVFDKHGFSVLQPLSSRSKQVESTTNQNYMTTREVGDFLEPVSVQKVLKENEECCWFITTILMHSSGQMLVTEPVEIVIKEKNNPQAFGSAVTYFRRYALTSLLRIPQVDDDANAATHRQAPQQQAQRPQTQQRPVNYAPRATTQPSGQ